MRKEQFAVLHTWWACICGVVLGLVVQRAALMRGAGKLKIANCELMSWCSLHNRNGVLCVKLKPLRMALNATLLGNIGNSSSRR